MDGNRLQVVSEERDHGVIMSEDLKWKKQCVAAVKQGNKILGMILNLILQIHQKKL